MPNVFNFLFEKKRSLLRHGLMISLSLLLTYSCLKHFRNLKFRTKVHLPTKFGKGSFALVNGIEDQVSARMAMDLVN
jgi:hypothetical protein